MPLVNRTRPRLGDVIEIPTPTGLAYAQYTHKHDVPPRFGALLRIFPGTYAARPSDFAGIVKQEPQFITFFPLGAACNRGIVHVVANEAIPEHALAFPVFRNGVRNREGRFETWWLWDGERKWKIRRLEPGMEKFPLLEVWNDTLLIERIVEGWRHENVT